MLHHRKGWNTAVIIKKTLSDWTELSRSILCLGMGKTNPICPKFCNNWREFDVLGGELAKYRFAMQRQQKSDWLFWSYKQKHSLQSSSVRHLSLHIKATFYFLLDEFELILLIWCVPDGSICSQISVIGIICHFNWHFLFTNCLVFRANHQIWCHLGWFWPGSL